jgi:hypothetical protein
MQLTQDLNPPIRSTLARNRRLDHDLHLVCATGVPRLWVTARFFSQQIILILTSHSWPGQMAALLIIMVIL